MSGDHDPDPPALLDLLALLDPDPVRAEACYLDLCRQLKRFLEWDFRDPDDAAQEVLTRGFRRIREGVDTMEKGARAYFFGIARNVIKEGWKPKHRREQQLDAPAWDARISPARDAEQTEARLELEQYLGRLDRADADLIVRYSVEGPEALVGELGITRDNLRVRVFRIRERLRTLRDGRSVGSAWSDGGPLKRSAPSRHGQTGAGTKKGGM